MTIGAHEPIILTKLEAADKVTISRTENDGTFVTGSGVLKVVCKFSNELGGTHGYGEENELEWSTRWLLNRWGTGDFLTWRG
jgi:hypothetical protein